MITLELENTFSNELIASKPVGRFFQSNERLNNTSGIIDMATSECFNIFTFQESTEDQGATFKYNSQAVNEIIETDVFHSSYCYRRKTRLDSR